MPYCSPCSPTKTLTRRSIAASISLASRASRTVTSYSSVTNTTDGLTVGAQLSNFLVRCWKASMNSIGSGKTIVVFWLTPISSSVCR